MFDYRRLLFASAIAASLLAATPNRAHAEAFGAVLGASSAAARWIPPRQWAWEPLRPVARTSLPPVDDSELISARVEARELSLARAKTRHQEQLEAGRFDRGVSTVQAARN
jgi:hypothetical protein